MKIGLVDVDAESRGKTTYPNLALMKLSAWHKAHGDTVEWYRPLISGHMDRVYLSRVFSDTYTRDYPFPVDADEVVRGGSGYAITTENGREIYHKELDVPLPDDVEHVMPDYSIYGIHDTAYGFMTRGCPRGCAFCHVAGMQGRISHEVAPLSEFWNGQKYINLYDPNVLACKNWGGVFRQLADSRAYVDFNQGLDIRLLTDEKAEALKEIRYKRIHFAWDRPEEDLRDRFRHVSEILGGFGRVKTSCYILANFNSTFQQDVERVEFVKSLNIQPYLMIYDKPSAPHDLIRLQRYANNHFVCNAIPSFAEFVDGKRSDRYGKTGQKRNAPKIVRR